MSVSPSELNTTCPDKQTHVECTAIAHDRNSCLDFSPRLLTAKITKAKGQKRQNEGCRCLRIIRFGKCLTMEYVIFDSNGTELLIYDSNIRVESGTPLGRY